MVPSIDTCPTQRPDNPVVRKLGPKRIDFVHRHRTLRPNWRGTKYRGGDHPDDTCPGGDAISCCPPHIRLLPVVGNPPDFIAAVVAYQQASIGHLECGHRASPNLGAVRRNHPAGDEIARRAAGLALVERQASTLRSLALGAVPGTMPYEKGAALILL